MEFTQDPMVRSETLKLLQLKDLSPGVVRKQIYKSDLLYPVIPSNFPIGRIFISLQPAADF